MRTNIYVDGFNLYYGCLKGTGYRWLDIAAMCTRVLQPKHVVGRIRYFTALVQQRSPADPGPVHQHAYLRALKTLPRLTVHLGHFLSSRVRMPVASPPPSTIEVIKTEEKGSDVNIASYMLFDGFRDEYDAAIVISNDSDLAEPVRLVRDELMKTVGILCPRQRASVQLERASTFVHYIRPNALAASQFAGKLTDTNGIITKPVGW